MEERLQEKEGKNVIGRALDFRKLKKENFLVIFLVGILLLVIAWPVGRKTEKNLQSPVYWTVMKV